MKKVFMGILIVVILWVSGFAVFAVEPVEPADPIQAPNPITLNGWPGVDED